MSDETIDPQEKQRSNTETPKKKRFTRLLKAFNWVSRHKIKSSVAAGVIALGIGGVIAGSAMLGNKASTATTQAPFVYSDFLSSARSGQIQSVQIRHVVMNGIVETQICGTLTANGRNFCVIAPPNENVVQRLEGTSIKIETAAADIQQPVFTQALQYVGNGLVLLLLLGLMVGGVAFVASPKGTRRMLSKHFGAGTNAKKVTNGVGVTLDDVAGIDEAKEDFEDIIEFLKDPENFSKLGGKVPKGALMVGPPGVGKTLIAKAIAGEAGVNFLSISGSDFDEKYVGVGSSRVRGLFAEAKKNTPCVIFIDEIDAVGRKRAGQANDSGSVEISRTLNQLLVEMDGFDGDGGIIVFGATNRPEILDEALLRPGRFDRHIHFNLPDIKARAEILSVHMKDKMIADDIDQHVIARGTPGFSGADLANLVNEAVLLAARRKKAAAGMDEFEDARDKVLMGGERKNVLMDDREREMTAYHEAGHALVGIFVEGNDPLHKVTIIPRGRALGVTMNLPERDRYGYYKQQLHGRMAMMFGGRVAEEMIFGKDWVSTGAENDIQQATDMATNMVKKWGMGGDDFPPMRYGDDGSHMSLQFSAETAQKVDGRVQEYIKKAQDIAREVLKKHEDNLHKLTEALLEHETLSGEDVHRLLGIEPPHKNTPMRDQKISRKLSVAH